MLLHRRIRLADLGQLGNQTRPLTTWNADVQLFVRQAGEGAIADTAKESDASPVLLVSGSTAQAGRPRVLASARRARIARALVIDRAWRRSAIGRGRRARNTLGRPACAVSSAHQQDGLASLSLGCIGNRTFAGLPDEELYICIPGGQWPGLVSKLTEIGKANSAMQQHYRNHQAQFAPA